MQQEIQSAGVRANAICGATAETHEEHIQRLKDTASLRMCQAHAILTKAYEPAYVTTVDAITGGGVEYLCEAGIRDCNELIGLGYIDVELAKQFLVSAVGLLRLCCSDDEFSADQAFGIAVLIHKAYEESLRFSERRSKVLQ